ncbi:MAG: DUF1552 domain-containing protein [Bdellovibrionales bacterium]
MVINCSRTRRQFLIESGSYLALPFLASLAPKAWSQVAPSPKIMLFGMDHGDVGRNWLAPSVATTSVGSIGAKERMLKSLAGISAVSPTWNNSTLNSLRLSDQMTIIRGLDVVSAISGPYTTSFDTDSAHCGHHLHMDTRVPGVYKANAFPTIESILETSRTAIPVKTAASVIRIYDGSDGWYTYKDPANGSLQQVSDLRYQEYPAFTKFYNDLFGSVTEGGQTTVVPSREKQLKAGLLDRIFPAYQKAINSRRISSEDRNSLNSHMQLISDLSKLNSQSQTVSNGCVKPARPTDAQINYNDIGTLRVMLRLLASAFKCGVSQVGVWMLDTNDPQWIPAIAQVTGGSHLHDSIHGDLGKDKAATCLAGLWKAYCDEIADHFLSPLMEPDPSNGRTYLDNMLVGVLGSGGLVDDVGGHNSLDTQQILFGSMGGRIKAGRYYSMPRSGGHGLPYNTLLITFAQLMGMTPAQYAFATPAGKGIGYYAPYTSHPYQSRWYDPIHEILT